MNDSFDQMRIAKSTRELMLEKKTGSIFKLGYFFFWVCVMVALDKLPTYVFEVSMLSEIDTHFHSLKFMFLRGRAISTARFFNQKLELLSSSWIVHNRSENFQLTAEQLQNTSLLLSFYEDQSMTALTYKRKIQKETLRRYVYPFYYKLRDGGHTFIHSLYQDGVYQFMGSLSVLENAKIGDICRKNESRGIQGGFGLTEERMHFYRAEYNSQNSLRTGNADIIEDYNLFVGKRIKLLFLVIFVHILLDVGIATMVNLVSWVCIPHILDNHLDVIGFFALLSGKEIGVIIREARLYKREELSSLIYVEVDEVGEGVSGSLEQDLEAFDGFGGVKYDFGASEENGDSLGESMKEGISKGALSNRGGRGGGFGGFMTSELKNQVCFLDDKLEPVTVDGQIFMGAEGSLEALEGGFGRDGAKLGLERAGNALGLGDGILSKKRFRRSLMTRANKMTSEVTQKNSQRYRGRLKKSKLTNKGILSKKLKKSKNQKKQLKGSNFGLFRRRQSPRKLTQTDKVEYIRRDDEKEEGNEYYQNRAQKLTQKVRGKNFRLACMIIAPMALINYLVDANEGFSKYRWKVNIEFSRDLILRLGAAQSSLKLVYNEMYQSLAKNQLLKDLDGKSPNRQF